MARGWESKAVEQQIEEGEQAETARESSSEVDRSPQARANRQHLESLRLSRARTLAQLEQATTPAYRQMLERALQSLEQQIEEVSRQLK